MRVSQTSKGSQDAACVRGKASPSVVACSSDATVALTFMVSAQFMPYSTVVAVASQRFDGGPGGEPSRDCARHLYAATHEYAARAIPRNPDRPRSVTGVKDVRNDPETPQK